jgi:hypothetical protein
MNIEEDITWEKRRPSHALSIARRVQILNKNGSKWLSRLYDRGTTSLRTGNKTETIFQVFFKGRRKFLHSPRLWSRLAASLSLSARRFPPPLLRGRLIQPNPNPKPFFTYLQPNLSTPSDSTCRNCLTARIPSM